MAGWPTGRRRIGPLTAPCRRASNDCSEDLTLEHYISDDLLESIAWDGKAVLVRGAAWLPSDAGKPVGVNSLSSRMLCGRHNRAL
jgi:hypothetical protein